MGEANLYKKLSDYFNKEINGFEIYYIIRKSENNEFTYNTFYCSMPDLKSGLQDDYKNRIFDVTKGKAYEAFDVIGSQMDSIEMLDSNLIENWMKIKCKLNNVKAMKANELKVCVADIWGYVIVYTNKENKKLYLCRKFTLSRKFNVNRKFSIIGGNLKEYTEEIFTLDYNIDSIELEGTTYITNKYYFEIFFSYNEEYVKCVEASMNDLKKENVIKNFDEFSTRCLESSHLVRKLVYVVKQDRLKWLSKNIKGAKAVIEEYNLKVKIDGKKIVYSKKDCNISDVMKLICGCCVKDAVDMHKYFASSVKEVS